MTPFPSSLMQMGIPTTSSPLTAPVFPATPWSSARRLTVNSRWSTATFRRGFLSVFCRKTFCSQDFWLKSSLISNNKMYRRGKWMSYAMREDMDKVVPDSDFLENTTFLRLKLRGCLKVHLTMVIHALSMSSFIYLRISRLNAASILLKMFNRLHAFSMQAFGSTNMLFASVSSSLNKPTPLKLDISLPFIGDLQWSLARMLYLFNMQVERNVATFLLVLIMACFSFVVIGGLLFFNFSRSSTQSLEDCFWEAWACLCSSSTHLRV